MSNTEFQMHNRSLKHSSTYNTVAMNDDIRCAPHPTHQCDPKRPEEDGTHPTVHQGGSGSASSLVDWRVGPAFLGPVEFNS